MRLQFIFLATLISGSVYANTLTVNINKVQAGEGEIRVALFNQQQAEHFPNGEAFRQYKQAADQESVQIHFEDLPSDQYALAVFQDKNNNAVLDKNFLGIPKEPYGFSGKPTNGPASFQEAQFQLQTESHEETLNLND